MRHGPDWMNVALFGLACEEVNWTWPERPPEPPFNWRSVSGWVF